MRFWEGRSDVEVIWMISGVLLPTLFLMASFMTLRAIVQNRIRRRQMLRAGVAVGMMEDEQRSRRRRRRIRLPGMPRFRMPTKEQVVSFLRRDRRRPVNLGGDRRAAMRMMESMEAARVGSAADVLAEAIALTPGVAEGMEMAGAPVKVERVVADAAAAASVAPVDAALDVPALADAPTAAMVAAGGAAPSGDEAAADAATDEAPDEDDAEAARKWAERMKDFDGRAPSDAAARVVNRGAAKEGGLAARVTARQKKQRKRIGRGKGLV